jgi:hypothetical protein
MIIGGEQPMAEAVNVWHETISSSVGLINAYGPTEATVVGTLYNADGNTTAHNVPIGRPIGNVRIYILDKNGHLVPIGVLGELYIGGDSLARGYWNRSDLTAEKFIPDSFAKEPGARLYRTGDLARYLPDGNIEFLGRIDNQVKIRGFRIEPGEIEEALGQHASIREAVVGIHEESSGNRRLIAYVVAIPGSALSINELRKYLRHKLPEYMVPSVFVMLESLPLTANGKIDRRALPRPDQSRPELDQRFVAPRTPTEELLVEIWANILQVDKVGVHDNFFDLGGHSLLATQVMARACDALRTDLPLRALFEDPTVAGLAERFFEIQTRTVEKDKLTDLLGEIESLSEEQAQKLADK